MRTQKYRLFTDGGARGNPGPAAIGAVLFKGKERIFEISKYIGETTNNQAEYRALIAGLEKALELQIYELNCFLDSSLVVHQLNGYWKVREPSLGKVFVRAWNLKQKFQKISFFYVQRERNKQADKLVNRALDKRL